MQSVWSCLTRRFRVSSEIPVEQATKFELVVNLKTAKALGIKIPNSIFVRADKGDRVTNANDRFGEW